MNSDSSMGMQKFDLKPFKEVASTMDTASKEIPFYESRSDRLFAVIAQSQCAGRGTQGREWMSPAKGGNLYMTVGIRLNSVSNKIPLSLLPLKIGLTLLPIIRERVKKESIVSLKWPNDILIDDKKVSGILIEVKNNYALVGVGCNIAHSPSVPGTHREATCIANHSSNASFPEPTTDLLTSEAGHMGHAFCSSIQTWLDDDIERDETASTVVQQYTEAMSTAVQTLRAETGDARMGERIQPLKINADGTLLAETVDGAKRVTLVADYLW
jgi:biotin-[acetyl-CoA-carboxylase] ligase BirA-like protein